MGMPNQKAAGRTNVMIYINASDKNRIKSFSAARGVSMSEFMVDAALREINRLESKN